VLSDMDFPPVLGTGKRWYGSSSELRDDEDIFNDPPNIMSMIVYDASASSTRGTVILFMRVWPLTPG
jgi:hypothetical protein